MKRARSEKRGAVVARLLLAGIAVCAGLAWARCAQALDPALDVSQYAHNAWSIRDGFLKGGVRAMVQTPDGYLWLGTEFGLVRFDGARFEPWSPPSGQHLPSANIRSLVATRDGALWIGTLEGLASWKDGKLTQYGEFAGQNVLSLLQDRDGTVWAGTFGIPKAKLCAIQLGNVKCYGDDGSLGQWVWSLFEDRDGAVWAGAETGMWRWKPGPPKRYPMPHPIETAQAIAQGDGRAEVFAIGEGIWRLINERVEEYPVETPPGRVTPVSVFRDRDGGLWVGTLQRGLLHVYQGKAMAFAQSDGLSGDRILCFLEDREGNVWVGTGDGLDRFREFPVYSMSVKQGISSPSIWSVLVAHDGSAWMSTLDGLNRWQNGRVTVYLPAGKGSRLALPAGRGGGEKSVVEINDPGLPDDQVGSLFEDDRGRIWVSTPKELARFERGRFSPVKEAPRGWVNAITEDSNGGVWISYQDHGLVRMVDDKVVERIPWSTFGGNAVASSMIPDPIGGGLWLGFFQGGLVYLKDGQVRSSYRASDGLGGGRVMGLELEPDGTLWASTEGGLSRVKGGRVSTLTSSNGLPCDTIHWAVAGNPASFWLYTACGLLRVPRAELEQWAADPTRKIQFTVFDSSDGVRSHALLTGYTPRVSQSPDGKLWFAHFSSVSVIDPLRLAGNTIAPPVRIARVTGDGKTYGAGSGFSMPPRIRDVAIDYTALSFVAPEKVHFRYKLEGQDADWREVINVRHVDYSNLAPKKYRFRVVACNNSGVWNEEGAFLNFSIAPAYYQTNWFRGVCVVAFLTLLWGLYQYRLHQIHQEFNIGFEARVDERLRIARELHDTLLQSFQGLVLRFQTACNLLPTRPEEAKQKFENAIDSAAQAITEGRDAVQGLRSSATVRNELAIAVDALAKELAANETKQSPPVFRVDVGGEPRDLHPIPRDEVYRIAGEAMRNAFRHAEANRIEVELHYDPSQLRLRVRDDGKGIAREIVQHDGIAGHWGLHGMRERAKIIGGNLEVWSSAESGTEVELTIPARIAYATASRRSWLSKKETAEKS